MAMETALAQSSLTRVERRDPAQLVPQNGSRAVESSHPGLRLGRLLAAQGRPDVQTFNVTEPKFYGEMDQLIQSTSLDDWKTYLRWHLAHAWAPYLSAELSTGELQFLQPHPGGRRRDAAAMETCVRVGRCRLGEALGQVFVAKTFGPEVKARTVKMTREIEVAMEDDLTACRG